jgi:AmmeMemoRadiSam system protein B/AmmeMemoRadiSam system protein A
MSNCEPTEAKVTREPANAGAFYSGDRGQLDRDISGYLSAAKVGPDAGSPRAIIVPHAGYAYSGATAGCAYRVLEGKAGKIRRVILLAPSHYAALGGIVINERNYRSPLGVYRLDVGAVAALKKAGMPNEKNPVAESREHADEVHIPFLQKVLPDARLVPLIVGDLSDSDLAAAANALAAVVDDETVIIVSSDFCHYGPRFGYTPELKGGPKEGIRELDQRAVDLIMKGDLAGFSAYLDRTGITICGRNPIRLLLKLFEAKGWKAEGRLLCYTTSGELTGDYANSVSYAAIALGGRGAEGGTGGELAKGEQETLVKLARHVLERFVRDGTAEYPDSALGKFAITAALKKEMGVFVTLKEGGNLRGCIGHIVGRSPIYRGVIQNAMNAAARDPRFQRVGSGELAEIKIEISVMSPLVRVATSEEIVVGRDGVVLVNGSHTGVFLPQVPTEQGWDRKTYLERLGEKAGMDRGA